MRLEEITEKTNTYTVWLDIDQVFADFDKGIEKLLGKKYEESKYESDPKYKKLMWDTIKEYRSGGGEFWYGLDLMPDAMKLWNYVKKYNPTFLSATGITAKEKTEDEKRRWVADKFGKDIPVIVVESAGDKKKYAKENRILIDDKEKAINPWIKAGGTGIVHTSAEDTIKQLKELGL